MTAATTTIEYTTSHRAWRYAKRAAIGTLGLAAILAAGFFGWSGVARYSLSSAHPPPGQMVDVGGYSLHLHCIGEGLGPTVILETGNADFSVMWAKVQPELAATARVCAYDRAGLGWSERGSAPRTLDAMTDELARLLDGAGINGKLLLVGHSFGGVVARSFTATYPDRVAGLVLIDPAHERQLEASPTMRAAVDDSVVQFRGLVPLASLGVLAILPQNIPNRGLPEAAYGDYAAVLATTAYFATAADETAMLPANLEAMRATMSNIGELPLTVLSRGRAADPQGAIPAADVAALEEAWQDLQADLAGLSAEGQHIVADGSGHYVQLDRPELVIEAVRQMLERL